MAMDRKTRTVWQMIAVIVVMGSLAWAAVPAYSYFCAVTGFGGVTQRAEAAPDHMLERMIKIRFEAATDRDMAWSFRPVQREMALHVGETGLAFYEAHNPTDRVIAGQASYNVAPYEAGGFFTKIECFCFTEQVLQPGETVQMPVTFYVDPAMVEDRDAKYISSITLGYTFYEIDLPEASAPGASGGLN
ncbi:cytochrome c oxidase assembly protein [Pseudooceanicola sp. CBS1P-1]|uniref:Cytochrome c oxidase assembly protein CtaG n=1 Tax=Pseudooceanicola albus TaxID=2692189 RepID=A0A6L7G3M2_9RHOB|nr:MULTISPECIES: cytochrome c oxidase assembly protein [Pseudooceanicola]MBT9382684.1 cytochrome c oxidase assembly protein [Pseudooceanicola endophyticus]MXN17223.1 cytochrome c oxidase assembly protein [Pseudooceanicola albus]